MNSQILVWYICSSLQVIRACAFHGSILDLNEAKDSVAFAFQTFEPSFLSYNYITKRLKFLVVYHQSPQVTLMVSQCHSRVAVEEFNLSQMMI